MLTHRRREEGIQALFLSDVSGVNAKDLAQLLFGVCEVSVADQGRDLTRAAKRLHRSPVRMTWRQRAGSTGTGACVEGATTLT